MSLASLGAAFTRPRAVPYVFGAMHAVVDVSTVSVVVGASVLHELPLGRAFQLILAYDLIAFAGQPFVGLVVDRVARPRVAVLLGLLLTAACVAVAPFEPTTAMLLAGVGNALFHVGAGTLALCAGGGRAAPSGIFVAPGALGLGLGTWLGRQGLYQPWPLYAALALGVGVTLLFREPATYRVVSDAPPPAQSAQRPAKRSFAYAVVGLFLASIAVRSLIGFAGTRGCPPGSTTLLALTLAAFGGKALGGVVSDRLGWSWVSVGALLLSAPLLAFGTGELRLIVPGMFLFQMTMPVTLTAVALILPKRPALAFGLTCLALIAGTLPTFTHALDRFYRPELFLLFIGLSALSLFVGLRALDRARPLEGAE
jgi:FSR family fosmidomycin resistance protein-like MFS transporter